MAARSPPVRLLPIRIAMEKTMFFNECDVSNGFRLGWMGRWKADTYFDCLRKYYARRWRLQRAVRYNEFLNVWRGHAQLLNVGGVKYGRCGQRLIESWLLRGLFIQIQCFGSFACVCMWLGRVLGTFVLIKWRVHILITIVVHFHIYWAENVVHCRRNWTVRLKIAQNICRNSSADTIQRCWCRRFASV